jgi:predicted DNA-binding transcriptional regulator AlpA
LRQNRKTADSLEALRVVDRKTAIELAGVSVRTWDRLTAAGEGPPVTKISDRRIGYRLSDLEAWLNARRVSAA